MSSLARRVAIAAAAVLSLQLVGALAIQTAVSLTMRVEIVRQLTRGMEHSGSLVSCTERPGPWSGEDDWWIAWPVDLDGAVVGGGAPLLRVSLPESGTFEPVSALDSPAAVYASPSAGCGGLLLLQRSSFPLIESSSRQLAVLVAGRIGLALLAGVLLVLVTALPLVRRIRRLAGSMGQVVDADFQGSVRDGADDEIGEVASAFDAAAATARERLGRLEHRDALLRRALADLAHDLRTPLTTLKLSTSSLPASPSSKTIRAELAFLEGMTRNFEALLGGDEEEEIVLVALDDLVARVEHRVALLARDQGLAFDTAVPDEVLHVMAESVALERAVSNLVENALRFARGHVVVLLFADGDEARLEVRDDGPGLGDLSTRAAERGVRGDAAAEQGFGLGLAIAEAAARRFGGRLELKDGEDGGAVIAIVLPLFAG